MNWNALLALEGNGAYVWSSFGMCFALMAVEVVGLRRRVRRAHAAFSVAVLETASAKAGVRDSRLIEEALR